ncbi:MAG: TIGR04282 family arsenosugar biosynthesis glycosyltransferase [Polyangiales bacterium]
MPASVVRAPSVITFGVMARAPIAGKCKTRLARTLGDVRAARLYQAMLLDTLELLALGVAPLLPPVVRLVVLAAPEHDGVNALLELVPASWEVVPQRGPDLGARLSNALVDLATDGHLVCLVDSDSPTLPREAFRPLAAPRAENGVVVGPCDDGGYYLIAASRPEPRLFDDVPWSTPRVMDATREACRRLNLPLDELRSWYDVDAPEDVDRLAAELATDASLAPRTAAVLSAVLGGSA